MVNDGIDPQQKEWARNAVKRYRKNAYPENYDSGNYTVEFLGLEDDERIFLVHLYNELQSHYTTGTFVVRRKTQTDMRNRWEYQEV